MIRKMTITAGILAALIVMDVTALAQSKPKPKPLPSSKPSAREKTSSSSSAPDCVSSIGSGKADFLFGQ